MKATCTRCGEQCDGEDPVPVGWTQLHVQFAAWLPNPDADAHPAGHKASPPISKHMLVRHATDAKLCAACGEVVHAAIAAALTPTGRS